MKTISTLVMAVLVLVSGVFAQEQFDGRAAALDLFAGLNGDMARFERGMVTVEAVLGRDPKNAEAMVFHGAGIWLRSGKALQDGDFENAVKLMEAGRDEMQQAVQLAPDNLDVRRLRGVLMITASRGAPPQIGKPFLETAVSDFEKVLELRGAAFPSGSAHRRGELLTGLADGWSRMGNTDKARAYFERIVRRLDVQECDVQVSTRDNAGQVIFARIPPSAAFPVQYSRLHFGVNSRRPGRG